MDYQTFLKNKQLKIIDSGFDIDRSKLNPLLFNFQKDLVLWALKKGKAALFTATGTGKTFMQCEFAKQVNKKTGYNCLIVAPLAVSKQTINEAEKLNIEIANLRNKEHGNICITNYEQLDNVDINNFNCVVLDESSILKNYSGKIRNKIIDNFKNYKYKLACTATPAPNDFMELGNHSEFLDYMTRAEMLAMFFIHDSGDTQKWRLKGHANNKFWEWLSSWAAILTMPSDLGYTDKKFILPKLNYKHIEVKNDIIPEGKLFAINAHSLLERKQARKISINDRVVEAAKLGNESDEIFLLWCDLNEESAKLKKAIKNSVEIKGADSDEHKEKSMLDFSQGKIKCLITKSSIAGFGMNWQVCHNIVFVGLSDSFERYYQSVRRCWRFGQKKEVWVYIITSSSEGAVIQNIKRKEHDAQLMINNMVSLTHDYVVENIRHLKRKELNLHNEKMILPNFLLEVSR